MDDYLQGHAAHARMMQTLKRREQQAHARRRQRDDNKRAVMTRLPTDPHPATGNTMLADLRALNAAFGTRATWIQCDGETLLGAAPERDGRVIPTLQYLTPSQD